MYKTYAPKAKDVKPEWHLIDAQGKVLGQVAVEIATLLTGKNKATYTPNMNMGDKVVVINAEQFTVTRNKMKTKVYHRVTGYPGGVKSETLEKLVSRRPTEAIKRAVKGMLPKNKLQNERMKNLYVYKGPEHPHQAQLS